MADSQAGFSGLQGQSGWYYGYYAADGATTTFADLAYQTPSTDWRANVGGKIEAPVIAADRVQPGLKNAMKHKWVVRRWVSGADSPTGLTISASLDRPSRRGDGIAAHLYINGVEQTDVAVTLLPKTVASGGYVLYVPSLKANDVLDFAIDDRANGRDDATNFYVQMESGAVNAVLADSNADFSTTQGRNGWSYGYFSSDGKPSSFKRLKYLSPSSDWVSDRHGNDAGGPAVADAWMQPGSMGKWEGKWADRRWVSDASGQVLVSGTVGLASSEGDGVVAHFYLNGAELTGEQLTLLPGPSGASEDYAFQLNLHVGDVLDFAIDPRGNFSADVADFQATIRTNYQQSGAPEPTTLALTALGLLVALQRRRRR